MNHLKLNRKILNSKEIIYDEIKFRSTLDKVIYKYLKDNNMEFDYEKTVFTLVELHKYENIKVFSPLSKKSKYWGEITTKPVNITYKPDFIVKSTNNEVPFYVIEGKGYANDVYPYKKKLFLDYLNRNYKGAYFFEVRNKSQILETIDIIKECNGCRGGEGISTLMT